MVLGVAKESVGVLLQVRVRLQVALLEQVVHGRLGVPEVRILLDVFEAGHVLAHVLDHGDQRLHGVHDVFGHRVECHVRVDRVDGNFEQVRQSVIKPAQSQHFFSQAEHHCEGVQALGDAFDQRIQDFDFNLEFEHFE